MSCQSPADARIVAIDLKRARSNLTHRALCELAGVQASHWFELRHGVVQPTDRTISQLLAALRRPPRPPAGLADLFRTVAGLFGEAHGLTTDEVFSGGQGPRACSRCRCLAMYVITVELLVSNVDLARAIGQTRQSIKKARDRVELWRDDPTMDALLEQITERVRWRPWHPWTMDGGRGISGRFTRARPKVAGALDRDGQDLWSTPAR